MDVNLSCIITALILLQAGVKFVVCSAFESFPQDVMAALPEIEPGYVVPHIQSKAKVKVSWTQRVISTIGRFPSQRP